MMKKKKDDMQKQQKQRYAPPAVLQALGIRLERNFMESIVDDVKPVETAGQKVDGEYDGSNSNTFNFDWSDGTV